MNVPATPTPGPADPLLALEPDLRARLSVLADQLIPEAHGMPSAGAVVGDARLRFVLGTRPDLIDPLRAALRDELGDDPAARLAALEREPDLKGALLFVIVAGYYTDKDVRERLGYPGQLAQQVNAWRYPEYLAEGLIDKVLARGPVWRDPTTGRSAEEPRQPERLAAEVTDPSGPASTDASPQQ